MLSKGRRLYQSNRFDLDSDAQAPMSADDTNRGRVRRATHQLKGMDNGFSETNMLR